MIAVRRLLALVLCVRSFFALTFKYIFRLFGLSQFYIHLRTSSAKRILSQAVSLVLIVSILTVSTSAAPQTGIASALAEFGWSVKYSFLSKIDIPDISLASIEDSPISYSFLLTPVLAVVTGVNKIFKKKKKAQQQEQQRPRAARLEISPAQATIRQGQQVVFSARGFDDKGAPIQGVPVSFKAIDRAQKTQPLVLPNGLFEPLFSGDFVVTAEADGIQASTVLRVVKDAEAALEKRKVKDRAQDAAEAAGAPKRNRGALPKDQQELAAGQPLPAAVPTSSRSRHPVPLAALGNQRPLPAERKAHPNTPFVPIEPGSVKATPADVQLQQQYQEQQRQLKLQQMQQQPPPQVPNADPLRRGGPNAGETESSYPAGIADDKNAAAQNAGSIIGGKSAKTTREMTKDEIAALRRDNSRILSKEKAAKGEKAETGADQETLAANRNKQSALKLFRSIGGALVGSFAAGAVADAIIRDSLVSPAVSPSAAPAMFGSTPYGNVDGVTTTRRVTGWSFDPDVSSQSIIVHFYFDGPAGSGTWGGYARATGDQQDVNNVFGIGGHHGFEFDIPTVFQDGNWHTVYAYGIDATGDNNTQLAGSGMWFNFASSGDPNWNDGNAPSAKDPIYQPGDPVDDGADGAGSGNFGFSAPVINQPARGDIGINLSLNYNSLLWQKSGTEMTYDIDRGFPAPGWTIGLYGKMLDMGVAQGAMLEGPDGTRHSYEGVLQPGGAYGYSTYFGHTTDGSMIDYTVGRVPSGISWAIAYFPNGVQINYGAAAEGAAYL